MLVLAVAITVQLQPRESPGREKREAPPLADLQKAPVPAAPPGERALSAREDALGALAAPAPEQWLQGVADLRRQGRHEQAERQLEEFHKRYPDYRIAPRCSSG